MDDYEVWAPDMNKRAGALIRQWVDVVLFANLERQVFRPDKTQDRTKVVMGETHLAYLETREGHEAKNRYSLPAQMEFRWRAIDRAMRANTAENAAKVRDQIRDLLPGPLSEQEVREVQAQVGALAHNDALRALQIRDKVRRAVAEAAERTKGSA